MNTSLSHTSTPANGTTADFAVSFGYLAKSDVAVSVRAEGDEFGTGVVQVDGVAYEWTSESIIHFLPGKVPVAGRVVDLVRSSSPDGLLVRLSGAGTLSSNVLNVALRQIFYLVQESLDATSDLAGRSLLLPSSLDARVALAGKYPRVNSGGEFEFALGTSQGQVDAQVAALQAALAAIPALLSALQDAIVAVNLSVIATTTKVNGILGAPEVGEGTGPGTGIPYRSGGVLKIDS